MLTCIYNTFHANKYFLNDEWNKNPIYDLINYSFDKSVS